MGTGLSWAGIGKFWLPALSLMFGAHAQQANELRFTLSADPRTFDPLLTTEASSEAVRYLTGGVLIPTAIGFTRPGDSIPRVAADISSRENLGVRSARSRPLASW